MKYSVIANHRFIHNNEDITVKFLDNSGVIILDNNSNEYLLPGDLSNEACAFYALKRIEYIKTNLLKKSA